MICTGRASVPTARLPLPPCPTNIHIKPKIKITVHRKKREREEFPRAPFRYTQRRGKRREKVKTIHKNTSIQEYISRIIAGIVYYSTAREEINLSSLNSQ
jgi:hypothetical protein